MLDSITVSLLALFGITTVVIAGVAIPHRLGQKRRQQTLDTLTLAKCPLCTEIFGRTILETTTGRITEIRPTDGVSLSELDIPTETLFVTCPHCSEQLHFRLDGQFYKRSSLPFIPPEGFERTRDERIVGRG